MIITPVPAVLPPGIYVYLHLLGDADPSDDSSVYYVGLGRGRRAWSTSRKNRFWSNVFSKHGRVVWIVEDGLTQEQAARLEVNLVAQYWVAGANLTNMTTGGEGTPHLSDDAKMRKSIGISMAKRGKPISDALRMAISRAHKGRVMSEQHKARLSAAARAGRSQLQLQSARNAGMKTAKPVMCVETGETHVSTHAAARWLHEIGWAKASSTPIRLACSGRARSAYGHTWRYAE